MLKFDNKTLTKEMITALKEVRALQESGKPVLTSELKSSLSNLYSENLIEPGNIEVDGKKVEVCSITVFGWEVIKHLDSEQQGFQS